MPQHAGALAATPRASSLGRLYRPKYFHTRDIAIHGYTFVPPYPASHECVRVSLAAMDHIWGTGLMPIGTRVLVYGSPPTSRRQKAARPRVSGNRRRR